MTLHVAYDDRLLNWRLDKNHPTDPIRAKNCIDLLKKRHLAMKVHKISDPDLDELVSVHDWEYVRRTLAGFNGEWRGLQPQLGETAALMFQGTVDMVDLLVDDKARFAFSPQGAKHHAKYDRGSGFCVFADFAYAAQRFSRLGERVLVIDLDAHHGDGTEALTRFDKNVMTASVHDESIFPGTGNVSYPSDMAFNFPLEKESGNRELVNALEEIKKAALGRSFEPTVFLIAIGGDGHEKDPLSTLRYTYQGYRQAADFIGEWAWETSAKVLMGGAGGYCPKDYTPGAWATFVGALVEAATD